MKLEEYKSVDEKKEFFQYQQINTEEEFKKVYDKLKNSQSCIFRGVREAKFKLYTSAQRVWIENDFDKSGVSYVDFIKKLLSELEKEKIISKYCKSLNKIPNDVFGLALLQHYSAPTPLLDFTTDKDIALFFALQGLISDDTEVGIDEYFSVYSISLNTEWPSLDKYLNVVNGKVEFWVKEYEKLCPEDNLRKDILEQIKLQTAWYRTSEDGLFKIPCMFVPNPLDADEVSTITKERLFYSNINIIAQEGCFLLHTDERKALENIDNRSQYISEIKCLDIHKSLASYIKMNIIPTIKIEDMYPKFEIISQRVFYKVKSLLLK